MDPETPKEAAKAAQEIAKTTSKAMDKLGPWVNKVIGEPTAELGGMLTDKLKLSRAIRRLDLQQQWEDELALRGITEPRPIPPKFALPIIENASIEHDDTLFVLWRNLLITGSDPTAASGIKAAYIDVMRGLDPPGAVILKAIHEAITGGMSIPAKFQVSTPKLYEWLTRESKIDEQDFDVSIENLIRLRCIQQVIDEIPITIPDSRTGRHHVEKLSRGYGSSVVELTPLGRAFVKACVSPQTP
jgi:hypothetical protein